MTTVAHDSKFSSLDCNGEARFHRLRGTLHALELSVIMGGFWE
jgi:hypothetical protein